MTSTLYQQIQQFYDASSTLWEEVWGEHMHHGYYGPEGNLSKERRLAQIDLIEEFLRWGMGFSEPSQFSKILDVGCGIGGSTLYLAEKFQAEAAGITLSPVQANRATERAQNAQLGQQVNFQVANALEMPFEDDSFDLLWSLESGEHMPNKQQFLRECYRVLKPGGLFLMATWCHRPVSPTAPELTDDERKHLAEIYRVYALPYVISLPEYEAMAVKVGFDNIHTADWSKAVAPFWNIVIDSAFDFKSILGLLSSGWTTIQAALSLGLMSQGYERGLIKFGLLRGIKPEKTNN
ncbi:MAG: methyltransferase domain-containing protein [Limnoraphis robusta]|uniref:Delta(24)-sterol C-methyltransferase n=2 Tax=Limnoraphis robusta TaxID=1118279 RepID=A0A0F5Y8R5_9CYAN|nr:methyltransferase domain-containing protein [Limnoraphis robusta]KKD35336.1 delta(24)-sterol C-methyltransferase [Limnoraphis robusta CS-951]MEA5521477.1 methyltransferase domain-containing protein [Limnoraphis robusta CCNP1315]MEA5546440.1 methyltransferase domain-containing protein [Limnoraphis robusta CCNP1324]